ncbi:MAG: glycoside hydrolase family 15 protein, partial [Myxococcota bacterium]
LHNFHLGFGRPNSPFELFADIGENGETLATGLPGEATFTEQGFAGAVALRALGNVSHYGTAPDVDVFAVVNAGNGDLPDNAPAGSAVDGAVAALQWDLGDLEPGEDAWVAVVAAHHGDPFSGAAAHQWLDDWIDGRDAQGLLDGERAAWATFQDGLVIPADVDADEDVLVRHSAAMLRMGQVREDEAYLREFQSQDGEVRRTRFPSKEAPATLPDWVPHRAHGAILASLPPGNWTYAWIRDGAYATSAMASLGMNSEAYDSLQYYLDAEAGRFEDWMELAAYDMPPYQMTLTRYYGFGVEETDFNAFGPNLEFDGFGLFLWALANYEATTGDTSISDERWEIIAEQIADVIVALIEPETGLMLPDSSILETHWNGRERHWTYTNITASRGLCDAATMAERVGDMARAETYRETALALRAAIAEQLTDDTGALASNLEELQAGEGYYDAAVIDAIAMGLFDPEGQIAQATIESLDAALLTNASEVGWARNDDPSDHVGAKDISPWGSDYDSAEWVITDLRGAIATRAAGDAERGDAMLSWVGDQSLQNFLMVAETYEEESGVYKFNHPMLGFGAGAYALALAHRNGDFADPACGSYFEDEDPGGTGDTTGGGSTSDGADSGGVDTTGSTTDGGVDPDGDGDTIAISVTLSDSDGTDDGAGQSDDDGGCSCRTRGGGRAAVWLVTLGLLGLRRRRRRAR